MNNLWYLYHHQGQGHNKIKVILKSRLFQNQNEKCMDLYPEAGGGPLTECILVLRIYSVKNAQSISFAPIHRNHTYMGYRSFFH